MGESGGRARRSGTADSGERRASEETTDVGGRGDPGGPRVLGVLGTFVLDRIVGLPGRDEAMEDLGGIAYALCAVAAAMPDGWRASPIARIGADASRRVRVWLESLDAGMEEVGAGGSLAEVPEPNNRVVLRYRDDADRTEHLTGGVGGWRWEELVPALEGCDALYINFVSGHELALEELRRLRDSFPGPVYADLHSLFLGTAEDGRRVPRPLPRWRDWVACFDAVQMNADELDLLRGPVDVETAVAETRARGPVLVVCTRGAEGATCWWCDGAESRFAGDGPRSGPRDGSAARREIPAMTVSRPDPTGCGDVWGGAMCCRLLAGESVADAALTATRLAAAAAGSSGVAGLPARLAAAMDDHRGETIMSDPGDQL